MSAILQIFDAFQFWLLQKQESGVEDLIESIKMTYNTYDTYTSVQI